MPLDFPSSPANGATYSGYTYDATKGVWVIPSSTITNMTVSDTAPSNPLSGDSWFDSTTGYVFVYYTDADSSQWVQTTGAYIDTALTNRVTTVENTRPLSPNYIINGGFDIWQRGTAAVTAAVAARTYLADRWFAFQGLAGGAFTYQQSTDVPSGLGVSYSALLTTTTADTSLATTDQYSFGQIIEGSNSVALAYGTSETKTVSLSFWVKSSITGTFSFAIRNSGPDRSYVSEYSVISADTWEKKVITIPGDSAGTWLTGTGIGLRCDFSLAAGSDYSTSTLNSWTATNDIISSNQTNFMAATGRTIRFAALQLEAGSVATPFRRSSPTLQAELAACQRYYQFHDFIVGSGDSAGYKFATNPLGQLLRTTPTVTATTTGGPSQSPVYSTATAQSVLGKGGFANGAGATAGAYVIFTNVSVNAEL